ncbi:MAG TPA: hypothetical protein VF790_11700 [Dissulfurispiraceae bacterium]
MKRTVILTIILLLLASVCLASQGMVYTLLSKVTATGAGTAQTLYKPMHLFNCNVVLDASPNSSAISAYTVNLEGSIDGVTYGTLATDSSPNLTFQAVDKPVNYIRGNLVSITSTDASANATLNCMGIGF